MKTNVSVMTSFYPGSLAQNRWVNVNVFSKSDPLSAIVGNTSFNHIAMVIAITDSTWPRCDTFILTPVFCGWISSHALEDA